ncbi:SRPBCC family protein [Nocardioides terrisoli]|uniref:SRPBCC family protein n=1 Tax=Nocardioides terrisoli TaxID=3388267 RepID=UPI00287BC24B|nr:SRPBCC family protein [Nocardioides marmorisolisilvae]
MPQGMIVGMVLSRYRFTHSCEVSASPERVHALLLDLERYPSWWPQVRAVASLGPDTALVVCRSVLPYDLELVLDAVSRAPTELEVRISGPIDGLARWSLCAHQGGTRLEYFQEVVARGALAWASYVIKPMLRWNHAVMMRGFDAGIASALAGDTGPRTG